MGQYIRHFIAAGLAFVIGAIVAAVGIEPNPEQITSIVDGLASGVTEFVMLVVYAVSEKFLKRFPSIDLKGFIDYKWLKHESNPVTQSSETRNLLR